MTDTGRRHTVATIAGDGIGPEVVEAAIPVIDAAAGVSGIALAWHRLPYGAEHYLKTGETLPPAALEELRTRFDAIFLGAIGDPRVPGNEHARDILIGLRFQLDLYINFRPCTLLHPALCPLKPPPGRDGHHIDIAIIRENTEGVYLGKGRSVAVGTPQEEQVAEEVHTAHKVDRILTAAFEWAASHGRSRVTMCDKSNAVPAHRLWLRLFQEIGERFPTIECEHRYVDALAMELVRDPERFQVIVTNNLYGDIVSDLASQLVGGLGLAPSANLHPGRPGLFEPVHGSAPTLAGRGVANPIAAILTGALMLRELGAVEAAGRIENGARQAVAAGVCTADLGGRASTAEVADWIRGCIVA